MIASSQPNDNDDNNVGDDVASALLADYSVMLSLWVCVSVLCCVSRVYVCRVRMSRWSFWCWWPGDACVWLCVLNETFRLLAFVAHLSHRITQNSERICIQEYMHPQQSTRSFAVGTSERTINSEQCSTRAERVFDRISMRMNVCQKLRNFDERWFTMFVWLCAQQTQSYWFNKSVCVTSEFRRNDDQGVDEDDRTIKHQMHAQAVYPIWSACLNMLLSTLGSDNNKNTLTQIALLYASKVSS